MKRIPRSYWLHWHHIAAALEPFIREHGYLPTQTELREMGLSSLPRVFTYFGGYKVVARNLGVPTKQEHNCTRLCDWNILCRELVPLIASRGYFPTGSELTREGRYDLIAAIRRYHGGSMKTAFRMGIPTYTTFHRRNSAGHWTKDRIIAAYKDTIRTHMLTSWPSPNDLSRLGYGALRGALQKMGHRTVRNILTAEGITLLPKPRKLCHLIPFTQQYHMSEEIFDRGELFYYFLGLVAADGSFISTRYEHSVELCIKSGDLEILEKLRDRISPTRPIHCKPHRKNPAHEAMRLKFNDRRLVAMLQEYIITHDKSHTLIWPGNIPDEHLHHFIRGYIDGDGTLGVALNRQTVQGEVRFYPVTRLRVLGTEPFLAGMTKAIHRSLQIKPVKVARKGLEQVFEIQYSGRHAEKILDWLYEGATICLARKREVHEYLRSTDRETLLANYGTSAGRYNYLSGKGALATRKESA